MLGPQCPFRDQGDPLIDFKDPLDTVIDIGLVSAGRIRQQERSQKGRLRQVGIGQNRVEGVLKEIEFIGIQTHDLWIENQVTLPE